MTKLLVGLWTLLLLSVLWLGYQANPRFYSFDYDYETMISRPAVSPSVQYRELNSSCEAIAQYRADSERSGVAPASAQPKSHVKVVKHQYPLNVDIHDASKSSPIADETGVYVGSDSGWFWKFDFDGEMLWSFYLPNSMNGIHSTAAVDDKKVYIGAYNGFMYALDKLNGNLVWANPVADFIGASPLLAAGALFISAETRHPDGLVAKLDCNTGETLWVSQWLGGHSHSSPAYDLKTQSILVGANSGRFYAFDASTGETLWSKQLKGPIKGTPLIHEGLAYIGAWDKNYHAIEIASGEIKWTTYMGGRIQTSLALVPEANLGLTNTPRGEIVAMNLVTGEIQWRLVHGDPNHQFSILVTQDPTRKGEFIAWSRCKDYQLCSLDAKTGKLLNSLDLPGTFTSVPLAHKNRIYISLDQNKGFVILE